MPAQTLATWSAIVSRGFTRFDLFERRICALVNRGSRPQPVRRFFAVISRLGDGAVWYSLMAVLALTQETDGRLAAAQMAVAALVGVAVYKMLKIRLVRERPFVVHPGISAGTAPLDRYSFPSGHTLHAVMFTVLAVAWFPLLAAVLVPFAFLVAASRVVLGLHYPTDVAVGALIGWGLAEAALIMLPPTT